MKTIKEHGLPELKIEIDDKGLRTQEASAELIVTDGETFFHDFYDEQSSDFYNKNIVKYIRVDEIEGLLERYNKSQEDLVAKRNILEIWMEKFFHAHTIKEALNNK